MQTEYEAATGPLGPIQWTVIEPTRAWAALRLGELWRARELVFFLTWRDVKVRYKQTAIGAGWAVLQPLITVAIFTLIFGRVAHLPSGGRPYLIFVFAAMLPWSYFAYSITQSGKSLVDNEKLITKVYFPRLALPIAATLTGLVDFAVGCGVFAVMMVIFGVAPTWRLLLLPCFLLMAIAAALGVGFWLSGMNVRYRDVKYVLPFLTQIWLFASPVAYTAGVVKGKLALVYALNPMAGVIDGFRWALLGPAPHGSAATGFNPAMLIPSILVTIALLAGGVFYFKHMDKVFADVI
ncbi:MAG TPA: ABC transporter permease [Chloroflexota bacterium]|nr:ABC transporter permease [Chloroflexota bacterium]